MRLAWFCFLSQLNKLLLPKIHRRPDLNRLKGWEKAIVGWKMWVTYRRLDAESAQEVQATEMAAKTSKG